MEAQREKPCARRLAATSAKMFIVLLISIGLGVVLLCMSYLLPVEPLKQHLKDSIPTFQKEGSYPQLAGWCSSTLDNFTDAIMLLTAAYDGEEPTLDKAMNLYYQLSSDELGRETRPVQSVLDLDGEARAVITQTYTRYWGGYLIVLKPLLSVMNYQQIRILNQIFQTGIVLWLILLLRKQGYGRFILPLVLAMGLLPMIVNAQSLTYSDVFYLAIGGCCVLVLKPEMWQELEKLLFLFLTLGIMTSFFDFLTYPLVSFGIPICLYFAMDKKSNFFTSLKTLVLSGFAWGFGYAGMWAGKWAAASVFTGQNALEEALASVLFRSGTSLEDGTHANVLDTIFRNVGEWGGNPFFILFWLFCVGSLVFLIWKNEFDKLSENLIFLPIACLPFLWYIAVRNHSHIHYFFTYKELVIFAFAIMCFFAKSVSKSRGKREPDHVPPPNAGR